MKKTAVTTSPMKLGKETIKLLDVASGLRAGYVGAKGPNTVQTCCAGFSAPPPTSDPNG